MADEAVRRTIAIIAKMMVPTNRQWRDVMRQRFLEGKGWAIERIWSRSWWKNPEREIDRIEARIGDLVKQETAQG